MSVNININMAASTTRVDIGVPDLEAKIDALSKIVQAQQSVSQANSAKLDQILAKENKMAADLSTLEQDVAAETTVQQSAITLLTNLSAQLKAAASDPTKIQAIATAMEANASTLAAAVAANTPAAVTPPAGP